MKIGITGNRGDLCLQLIERLEKQYGTIDKISLFGNEWKNLRFDYDVLIHIAGVIPKPGVRKEMFVKINKTLSENVADKAYQEGTRHVIVFSTMAVYGMIPSLRKTGGIIDTDTPCCPDTDYGITKLQGEEAFRRYESEMFRVTYLRIPSVYYEHNTMFMNVAKEMYDKFPRYYPKLAIHQGRGAIYAGNVCECVMLTIERAQYGIICPQDEPVYSLYDYMELINEKNGRRKKSSRLLGIAVRMVMTLKTEWKEIYGQIKYDSELSNVMNGDYRKYESKTALLNSMD